MTVLLGWVLNMAGDTGHTLMWADFNHFRKHIFWAGEEHEHMNHLAQDRRVTLQNPTWAVLCYWQAGWAPWHHWQEPCEWHQAGSTATLHSVCSAEFLHTAAISSLWAARDHSHKTTITVFNKHLLQDMCQYKAHQSKTGFCVWNTMSPRAWIRHSNNNSKRFLHLQQQQKNHSTFSCS